MPELSHGIGTLTGEAPQIIDPGSEQALRPEVTAVFGDHFLRGHADAHETSAPQAEVSEVISEMPTWHAEIDLTNMTKEGLIKACAHFAAIAAKDPVAAEKMAERTIAFKRGEAEMRQLGMDQHNIRKQQWSSMLKRHNEKISASETPKAHLATEKAAAEPAPQPILQDTRTPSDKGSGRIPDSDRLFNEADEASSQRAVGDNQPPISHITNTLEAENTKDRITHPEIRTGLKVSEQPSLDSPAMAAGIVTEEERPIAARTLLLNAENELSDDLQREHWIETANEGLAPVYDHFMSALQAAIPTTTQEAVVVSTDAQTGDPEAQLEASRVTQTSKIAVAIVEHLGVLDAGQRADIASLLAEIIEEAQAANAFLATETMFEVIEIAKEQLVESVIKLLQRLEIAHEQADVTQFVEVLLHTDFLPAASGKAAMIDLEHDGTHEAKIHFAQVMSSLSGVEENVAQLLGKLVMFHLPFDWADAASLAA